MQSNEVNMQLFYFVVHKFIMVFIEFKYTSTKRNVNSCSGPCYKRRCVLVLLPFFWYVQCGVCCQRTIDQKKYKKHTDTQQALQRHSIVIICYSISFICCENCLGSTESTSRLGRKLYGFDFDTVSLFIVVFLFSICIRYR